MICSTNAIVPFTASWIKIPTIVEFLSSVLMNNLRPQLFSPSALKSPDVLCFRDPNCWEAELFHCEMLLYTVQVISGRAARRRNCWTQPWMKTASWITAAARCATWRVKRSVSHWFQCCCRNGLFTASAKRKDSRCAILIFYWSAWEMSELHF